MQILELFGGIGSPREALENIDIDIRSIDYVEILKSAVNAYNGMFDSGYRRQDVLTWNLNVDILAHGSPCQDFSKNGNNDIETGRSIQYTRTLEIIEKELIVRPKVVKWENVANLLSKRHVHHFNHYLEIMEQMGYNNYYKILNASDHGIPQNRDRVFCISFRKDVDNGTFKFPEKREMQPIQNFIDTAIKHADYPLTENEMTLFLEQDNELYVHVNSKQKLVKLNEFDVINTERPTSKTRRGRVKQNPQMVQTLTTNQSHVVYYNGKLRRLTALEHWKLMGYTEASYYRLKDIGISDNTIITLAGNSIVVPVLEDIFKEIIATGVFNDKLEG